MSTRLSIKGSASSGNGTPSSGMLLTNGDSSKTVREDINKIQQDMKVLAQKIAEVKGEPFVNNDTSSNQSSSKNNGSTSSPFVVGLRNIAESERKLRENSSDIKLTALEKLLEKVCEYDRLLLAKTAPEPVPGVQVRRKSIGLDLYTLPTHLHMSDRLIDLHTQSQRVTVIKTSAQQQSDSAKSSSAASAAEAKQIENLKATNSKLTKQSEEFERRYKRSEEELAQTKKTVVDLNEKVSDLEARLKKSAETQAAEVEAAAAKAAAASEAAAAVADSTQLAALKAEISKLLLKVADQDALVNVLQERIEVESGTVQAILRVLLGRAARLNSSDSELLNNRSSSSNGSDCAGLPQDVQNALRLLDEAQIKYTTGLRNEISLLLSIKDVLEADVSSANLQKDMLQKDLQTVTDEHEALKTAYDSLSYESARQQSQLETSRNSMELLKEANLLNESLKEELSVAKRKLIAMEQGAALMAAAEAKLSAAAAEQAQLRTQIENAQDEVAQYKRLTETLKQKIKELGSKGSKASDNKEFLDSFEEVMREEMMTMKSAFEGKLRRAREDAEEASKRHHQEILRIQNTSPYSTRQPSVTSATTTTSVGAGSSAGIAAMGGIANSLRLNS